MYYLITTSLVMCASSAFNFFDSWKAFQYSPEVNVNIHLFPNWISISTKLEIYLVFLWIFISFQIQSKGNIMRKSRPKEQRWKMNEKGVDTLYLIYGKNLQVLNIYIENPPPLIICVLFHS